MIPKEPGREMDALVAEKVMRWKFTGGFDLSMNSDRWAHDPNGHEKYFSDVPYYSTSIEAAWEVVEEMLANGCFGFCIENIHPTSFRCSFHPECEAFSKTAPHAICLAALRAMRVE